MSLLIGLLPAIGWGLGPIIANLIGGKAINQLLGITYGQLIVGIVLYLIFHPTIPMNVFFWTFLGGALWSGAQLSQFQSFKLMNVSSAMPISTGLQLIETPLVGVLVWGEWGSASAKIAGFVAIIVLILGIVMTSYNENKTSDNSSNKKKAFLILLIGSFGYTATNVFPRIPNAGGITSVIPQTIGMFVGAVIAALIIKAKNNEQLFTKSYTVKNVWNGILAGIGTFGYLLSMSLNGVATAFPLTQLNVVVSSILGIVILHEHKSRKELFFTIIGLILIMASAVVINRL